MEAVADDVCQMLGALFTAADLPQILCQFAGISSPAGHPPLDIRSGPAGGLSSFKDPWCDDKAARSLDETGMYEAAANILWLHAFSRSTTISGDPPTWLTVVEIRDKEMIAAASAHVSVRAEVPRIVFPITVPAMWSAQGRRSSRRAALASRRSTGSSESSRSRHTCGRGT